MIHIIKLNIYKKNSYLNIMNNINLNSKIWGPHGWFFIDSIILSLPSQIDYKLQQELKLFFLSLKSLLPCEKCKIHFTEYIEETKLNDMDLSSKEIIIKWINNLHNRIRISNNSKIITINEMYDYYLNQYQENFFKKYIYNYKFLIFIIIIIILCYLKYINFM